MCARCIAYSVNYSLSLTHTHTHTQCHTYSPHPENFDQFHLTDQQQVIAQATDDSPDAKNIMVYLDLKSVMPDHEAQELDSSAIDNASKVSDEAIDEQLVENGCFPSVDTYRKLSENGELPNLTLIYCSQVCTCL